MLARNATTFRNWLTTLPPGTTTLDAFRGHLKAHPEFSKPDFIMSWGDSFLLDQMFFKTGGRYKLTDFPALVDLEIGKIVILHGAPRCVTKLGLLTFDAEEQW